MRRHPSTPRSSWAPGQARWRYLSTDLALPPAAGGAPKQLVVFLHGYGADGNDLIGLGREWAHLLPNAAFVSPNAPEPCAMSPMGRQWFNLTFRDSGELVRGVKHAGPVLDAFLDAELKRHESRPPRARPCRL